MATYSRFIILKKGIFNGWRRDMNSFLSQNLQLYIAHFKRLICQDFAARYLIGIRFFKEV